jgi:hypothetical protein
MSTKYFDAILAITVLFFNAGAMAENMSLSEFRAAEKKIVAEYKSNRECCYLFAASDKEICMIEAKRTQKIAKAALVERYKPVTKATSAVLSRPKWNKALPKKTVS